MRRPILLCYSGRMVRPRSGGTDFALAAALLTAAALALYWSALRHPLVFDDFLLNRNMLRMYYAHATDRIGAPRWLSDASFWWVHAAFAGGVLWQRLANVLLHAMA